MTKGALYHQFAGKKDLFLAVLRQVQQEVADRVQDAARPCADPWKELVAGCEAFLTSYSDPEIRQIMLIDAPIVLGWREWKERDEACSERLLTEVLTSLMENGILVSRPVAPLVRLLSGAMNEAALWLAETESPTALKDTMDALLCMLGSLRADRTAPTDGASSVAGMSQRLPSSANVVLKGIREEPSAEDGARVLVDRLWPRGVSTERAAPAEVLAEDESACGARIHPQQVREMHETFAERSRPIVLIGPMAAGKTYIGTHLARFYGYEFLDADQLIVERYGEVSEIFEIFGEAYFRELERKTIEEVLTSPVYRNTVFSLGGGAPMTDSVAELLKDECVVYILVDADTVTPRITGNKTRPLLQPNPVERWTDIFERRRSRYEELAHFTLDARGGRPTTAENTGPASTISAASSIS